MRTARAQHAHSTRTARAQHAHSTRTACARHAHSTRTACAQHAHGKRTAHARRTHACTFDPREAAVSHEEEADAGDDGKRRARAQHEPTLADEVEEPAAQDWAEGLAEAVDGAGDSLHDTLLHGHVGEERGEAGHGEPIADGDEREGGGQLVDAVYVRERGEAERGRRHGDEQRALLADTADDEAHEHALHEEAEGLRPQSKVHTVTA